MRTGTKKEHKKRPGKFKEQLARHKAYALFYDAHIAFLKGSQEASVEAFGVRYSLSPVIEEDETKGWHVVKFNKGVLLCYLDFPYGQALTKGKAYYLTNKEITKIPDRIIDHNKILAQVSDVLFLREFEDSDFKKEMMRDFLPAGF